jgi:hypothetical protein
MGIVQVTVSGPGVRVGVALPDDVAVAELIPDLVARCEPKPEPWSRWALGPQSGEPFPPRQALAEIGVMDGAELRLRDMIPVTPPPGGGEPGEPTGEPGSSLAREAHRRRLTELVERTVDDIAKIRAGQNPLLDYASPEARRKLRGLAPGTLDRTADAELVDLGLAVRWSADPGAPVAAVAAFTERRLQPGEEAPTRATATAEVARRVTLRLLADWQCRQLIDLEVSSRPGA